jgi:hypothetical protein
MRSGGEVIKLSEDIKTRALVFRFASGEREALTTNLEEDEVEEDAPPKLYCKRCPVETKYNQARQKMDLENFSGRLAGNVKQDFHAMTTAPDMPAGGLREANEKAPKGKTEKRKRERRANVSHAAEALKGRLIGMPTTDDSFARNHLYRKLASETRRRAAPARPNREVARKEHLRKPHFHHNHKSNC